MKSLSSDISTLAGSIASEIGRMLCQTYERRDGGWWLCNSGVPVRPLTPDEMDWHIARRHAPFVPGGIEKDDPKWWEEPSA